MNAWSRLLGTDEIIPPQIIKVRALDAIPYHYGVWCTVGDEPKPFVNEIVTRRWSEDGKHIWFMLDSHNFMKADPDEELELVDSLRYSDGDSHYGYSKDFLEGVIEKDAERMAARPPIKDDP